MAEKDLHLERGQAGVFSSVCLASHLPAGTVMSLDTVTGTVTHLASPQELFNLSDAHRLDL